MKFKKLPKIEVRVIPHHKQRYDVVGDFFEKKGVRHISISEVGDPIYEMALVLHELVEWIWCKQNKISDQSIDEFEMQYEEMRQKGLYDNDKEPGWDIDNPCFIGHAIADKIERHFIRLMKKDWRTYDKKLDTIWLKKFKKIK